MNPYDVIVIGAGHNGLTTAALLAKQGRRVLILERRKVIGGICAGEEFHPGYRTTGLLHDTARVRPHVVETLGLGNRGLQMINQRPAILALTGERQGLMLDGDVHKTIDEMGSHSQKDAEQYKD